MEIWDVFDEERRPTGRTMERGTPMKPKDFHVVVHVWIQNSLNECLITKRTSDKESFPGFWEATGGSALAGETSREAALREVKEETGIDLSGRPGGLFHSFRRGKDEGGEFVDVWLFTADFPVESVVFQEHETCGARWASWEKLREMMAEGIFIGKDIYPYFDELAR